MTTSPILFSTLLTELTDPSSQVCQQAIRSIMHRRSERAQAYPLLLTLLKDPDEQVCKIAIKALGTLNDPRAFPSLVQMLTHRSARLRLLVLKTLARLDPIQTIPYWLVASQDDPSKPVRQAATMVLREASIINPLITTLGHTEPSVRFLAAIALGRLGDVRAIDPLIATLNDADAIAR